MFYLNKSCARAGISAAIGLLLAALSGPGQFSASAHDRGAGGLVADAGYDRHAAIGQTIQLDASRSLSPSGRTLSYRWSIVSRPAGSAAALSDATAIRPKFTVDVAGDYLFALQLRADDSDMSAATRVTVSTANVTPVADAGLNRRASKGATIAFDGAGSFDADGDQIGYTWKLVQKPRDSKAALSSASALRPSLTLDRDGTYVAELTVTDATGRKSKPARVAVSTRDAVAGKASAGPAQTLALGATARIDADGAYMPSGAPAMVGWALLSKPNTSKSKLSVAADARQALTPDVAGDYVVQSALGGVGKCGDDDDFDDDRFESQKDARLATTLITTGNVAPVADAGADRKIAAGASVQLDASAATDVNGDLLTYSWSLISKPAGSNATFDDGHAVKPRFTADQAGTYVAQLIVDDGFGAALPATVVLSTLDSVLAPVADAGRDVMGKTGSTVTLDGSASRNPPGGALTPAWTILGLGDQLTGSLTTPTQLSTGFRIPVAGVPLSTAVLNAPASIALTGYFDDWKKLSLAAVGALTSNNVTYTIWRIRNLSTSATSVTLDSPGSSFSKGLSAPARSDLFVASPINASHRLLSGSEIIAKLSPSAIAFADQRLVGGGPALKLSIVQLVASNGLLFDADDTIVSTVETRPVSIVSATTPARRNAVVQLDGSGSLNPNRPDAPTTGLTYRWTLLSRPAASHAALNHVNAPIADFVPDAYGVYVAQLIVSDGVLASRPRTVVMEVAPRAPVAAAAAMSPVPVGAPVALDGSASQDPDGNTLSYSWTLTQAPAGSAATIASATSAVAKLTPDIAGSYVVSLTVSDAYGVSSPATVTIVAQGGFAFTPVGPQAVALGSNLAFKVVANDPAHKPVTYAYVGGLPAGATFDTTTGVFSFRPASNNPASYDFTFQATNGADVTTLTVPVSVTGAASGTTGRLVAQVYDAVDYANGVLTPVANVVVSSSGVTGASDSSGAVSLEPLPEGQGTLLVSTSGAPSAPDGAAYLDAVVSASVIPGVTNTLDGPILLARSTGGSPINGGGTTTVTNASLGVTLTIAQNSAFNADGTPYTGQISIGSLPANTPVNLPPGFAPCQLLVISPVGVTFNPAAKLTVANNDHLPAGAQVDLWAFDPQLSTSRVVGIGQVSADGATIATLIGGVPGGTVLAMMPRRLGLAEQSTQPTDTFAPSVLGGGDMATSFSPPGTRQLNAGRGLTFVYHASTASAHPIIDTTAQLGAGLGLPQTLTTKLTVAGVTQPTTLNTNLARPLAGASALDATRNNVVTQAGVVDASNLASGAYRYSFLTISKYACSSVGSQSTGSLVVNNQSQSVFGAGWQLAEVQKINRQADGSLAIVEGNGKAIVAHAEQAPDFLPNPVYVPVNGPFLGAAADLLGSGAPSLLRLGWKDGSLNVILNKGNREFVKTSSVVIGDVGTQNPDGTLRVDVTDVAAGDITGDGSVDVAYINSFHNQAKILFGASGGMFRPVPLQVESNGAGGSIVTGDFIGDGQGHLMMSENQSGYPDFHIIYNDGKNNFTFHHDAPILPGYATAHVKVRLPGFQHDTVAGLTQNGRLVFTYGGNTTGDGNPAWTRGPSNLGYGQVQWDEQFIDQVTIPTAFAPYGPSRILATGDLDASGAPSFAIATASAVHVVKWLAPGANNQVISQTLTLPNGLAPDSVTLAPLAKGNRPSLIVTAKTAGFYVFLNDGKGNFATTPVKIDTPFRVGYETNVVDFDNDGVADIAVNDIDNDRVAIYFGRPHPDGAFVSPIGDYTRLVQNANGTFSRIYNDGTVVTFDANGFQTAIADANGNTTNYSYASNGQLTTIVDPTGATTSFTYAGAWLASTTDGSGRTTSYEHDASGNLTKITDPLGNVTQYLYDAAHQLIATIDPNGGRTQNAYSATGQLKQQTYPDGASVRLDVSRALGLDALGVDLGGPTNAAFVPVEARISQMQDAKGNLSETEVNEWGAVTRVTDVLGRVSRFWRDDANRVVNSEIPAGTSTGPIASSSTGLPQIGSADRLVNDYVWDGAGNLIIQHEAVGHALDPVTGGVLDRTTLFAYEPTHNKLVQKTDAEGHVTRWAYDANGNMTAMTDALGGVMSYTYDARGLQLSKTDPLGHTTSYAYDTSGNLTRTTDALGTRFDRYYDAAGNVILTIDAVGATVERRRASLYDANNRVTSQTSASGEITRTEYDANGNVARVTDPAGNVTTRVFDGNDRLLSETTPDAGASSFTYDENGNRLTATDASGAVTRYAYDAANRLVTLTDALNATRSVAYDLRDNAVAVVNARGKTTKLDYDIHKRLTKRADPAAGPVPNQYLYRYDRLDNLTNAASPDGLSVNTVMVYDALSRLTGDNWSGFAYDAASNLVWTANGNSGVSYDFAYDALNRRVGAIAGGSYLSAVTFTYGYDALSRRAVMRDSQGGETRYGYDSEDRVTSIVTPWGGTITQSYDAAGRPLRLAYPNGLDADLSFESATGRLASVQHRAGSLAAPIAKFDHAYDVRGNLKTLTELTGQKSFAYDPTERLTTVTNTATAAQIESYAYDPEGNRIATHLSPAYVTDDADRVLDDGINTYQWSMDGELTKRTPKAGGVAYDFTSSFFAPGNAMRLATIHGSDGGDYRFYYDSFSRLVSHHWPAPRGGFDNLYYDGPDVALERRRTAAGDQWLRYVHGQRDDQPLATEVYAIGAPPTPGTGQQFYYHADGEGSIRLLTDAAGQVTNRYDYDSYGRRLAATESLTNQPYGWKGREWIPGPDIYYNRARFYDPVLGRFLSQDPLGYDGGDSNLYSFAWNNTVNWNDPSGLKSAQGDLIRAELNIAEEAEAVASAAAAASNARGAGGAAGEYAALSAQAVAQRTHYAVIGLKIACTLNVIADAFGAINDGKLPIPKYEDCSSDGVAGIPRIRIKRNPCGGFSIGFASFEAGTLIETALGRKPIEEIEVGDLVAARDEFTGAINWRPVRELFRRTAPSISRLTLDGPDGKRETLSVTSEHPFFVEGKGWLEVRRLQKGDRVISEKNALLAVAEISHDDRPTPVYNFEVAQDHNYFVGEEGAEAHNGRGYRGKIREDIARRAGFNCEYCGISQPLMGAHCDHYWPWSRGGPTDFKNGVHACAPCNLSKGAQLPLRGSRWKLRGR